MSPRLGFALLLALTAGGATPLLVAGAQGAGSDHPVTAGDSGTSHSWTPATITIPVGDSVTWSYPSGASTHNVHFTDAGNTFPDQPPHPQAAGWSVQRTFDTDGTYHYQCALHSTMQGTIVVGNGGPTTTTTTTATTTTTTTATDPYGTPTVTETTPTTTSTTPTQRDIRAPRATRVRVVMGRLRFTLDERARLQATLTRGGRRVARITRALGRGAVSVRLPAHLAHGRYILRFTLRDAAGNTATARTLRFAVR